MTKKKKKSKKRIQPEPEDLKNGPHSFVIKRNLVGKNINKLVLELRKVLEPNTASQLKVRKNNVIKDFVSVASIFRVSHLLCFTKTEKNIFLRISRLPHGPTLIFKVKNYTFGKDVRSSLRRPVINDKLFQKSPLLVMNSFSNKDKPYLQIVTSIFRSMFPSVDINNVKLKTIKRCVLLNYNQETNLIDFRQYAVKIKPIGLSKPIKKLVSSKKIPNLSKLKSLDDIMVVEHGFTSESEGELDELEEQRHVTLSQPMNSKGNMIFEKSAIRCIELGPRLTLDLIKIQEGLFKGKTLFSKTKSGKINFDLNEEHNDYNDESSETMFSDLIYKKKTKKNDQDDEGEEGDNDDVSDEEENNENDENYKDDEHYEDDEDDEQNQEDS